VPREETPPPLLEGRDVTKRYGGLSVLEQVSFRVDAGEIVALIGPNGAGKTTLFNIVSGLTRPTAGAVRLDGHDITWRAAHAITRRGIGRTFQAPRPFLDLTAADNVRAAARFGGRPGEVAARFGGRPGEVAARFGGRPGEAAARFGGRPGEVAALLARVELADAAHVPARQLSAARRRLLELAMALAQSPRLLLVDEILGGLLPAEAERVAAILRAVRAEQGIAVFWIDHVVWAVAQSADRVMVLHHGELIADGAPQAVLRDERVVEAYLGRVAAAPP
jgi:branched-chain amino acid transport system ATP-binding protein